MYQHRRGFLTVVQDNSPIYRSLFRDVDHNNTGVHYGEFSVIKLNLVAVQKPGHLLVRWVPCIVINVSHCAVDIQLNKLIWFLL